jgi:NAD(P)-dependent dehydrogenase (short-subunit alcohol dehydrogenase family)
MSEANFTAVITGGNKGIGADLATRSFRSRAMRRKSHM